MQGSYLTHKLRSLLSTRKLSGLQLSIRWKIFTKKEAQKLGWNSGSLEAYAPGCSIGGDYFGNYEGLLPDGPTYTECDIDTVGAKSRGAKRIVFSSDGYIYYTDDHYESFTVIWFTEDYEMKEAEVK